jgi:type I restriction enzyme S subunit
MSRIDDLITSLCPEGVEFKKLGEFARLSNTGVDKKLVPGESEVSLLNYMDICRSSKITSDSLSAITTASPKKAAECNLLRGDVFITPSSETRGDLANAAEIVSDIPNAVYSYHILRIRLNDLQRMNPTFLVHLFASKLIQEQIIKQSTGMTRYGLTKPKWESLIFPMPPRNIQDEIVLILDKFQELNAELNAELEARKLQFEFYRKSLLNQNEEAVKLSNLSDVYDFQYGTGNTIPTSGGIFPVYGSNGIVGTHSEFNSEDAPVIGHIGAYAGIVNWAPGKHFVTYNGVICSLKEGHNSRFGYHLLKSLNLRELANAGSQPFVSYDKLRKVQVWIPDLKDQIRIAKLLDNFESLVNDEVIGLPAEIKARRQQYSFYLDKLLGFKELEAV